MRCRMYDGDKEINAKFRSENPNETDHLKIEAWM
jgi:hypothetical protein